MRSLDIYLLGQRQNKMNLIKNKRYVLCLILILGFGLRLYSINYGLPYVVGPDETRQVLDVLSMGSRFSLIPQDFAYAALHKYFLLLLYGIYFIFGKITGLFSDKFQFALKFMLEPYSFYLLARIFSAAVGTITILIVYRIGEKFYNSGAGMLAALFMALNFHAVQLSYWVSADILLLLFSGLTLLFIHNLLKYARIKDVVAVSLCVGLAISSKLQGIMLVIPLAVALFLKFRPGSTLLKMGIFSFALIFLSAFIGNAQYLIKSKEAIGKLMEILQASQVGISSAPVFGHNLIGASLWYFKELIRQDGAMGLIFCFGAIHALFNLKNKENIIFMAFLFTFLFSFSRASLRYVYYGALVLPVFAIFAARFVSDAYVGPKIKKTTVLFSVVTVIIFSLTGVLGASFKRSNLDTRQYAKKWIERHIPKGARIAVDWPELSVPLDSEIPFMMRTGNALNFYKSQVPQTVRTSFEHSVMQGRQYYDLLPVLHQEKDDFWPKDMPCDAIERINKLEFVKRLYSYFNFFSLDELKNNGAQYLVISSYSYAHFLLDDDPHKTELFNPYIREDTLINNRQAKHYMPGTQESALFYLIKKGRDFYSPILDSRVKGLVLLKEFNPGGFNLGPVIKIYKFS